MLCTHGKFSHAATCHTVDASLMARYEMAIKVLGQGVNNNSESQYPCVAGGSAVRVEVIPAEIEMAGYLLSLVDGSKVWTKEQSSAIESFTGFNNLKTKNKAIQVLYGIINEGMAGQNFGIGVMIYQWKTSLPKASAVLDKYDKKWDMP